MLKFKTKKNISNYYSCLVIVKCLFYFISSKLYFQVAIQIISFFCGIMRFPEHVQSLCMDVGQLRGFS